MENVQLRPHSNDQVGWYHVSVDEKKNRRREVERICCFWGSANIVRLNKNKKKHHIWRFGTFAMPFIGGRWLLMSARDELQFSFYCFRFLSLLSLSHLPHPYPTYLTLPILLITLPTLSSSFSLHFLFLPSPLLHLPSSLLPPSSPSIPSPPPNPCLTQRRRLYS